MMCYAISATKANRLYWLGRYAERVYLSLHLLRRYHDKMIDGAPEEYEEYYRKLDISNPYPDKMSFRLGYMYDAKNPCSLLSGLEYANDNAIVLREEISSETLSYIQMSLCHIKERAAQGDTNITNLQAVTDCLLSFWGSIDERVFDERIRNFLRIGRLVEHIDLHVRFDYPFSRIIEAYESLKGCTETGGCIFDRMIEQQLDEMLTEEAYEGRNATYKTKLLKYINHLVLL